MNIKRKTLNIMKYLTLILVSIIMIFPFYWMVRSSFMTDREILTTPIIWIPNNFDLKNYIEAFRAVPLARYFLNTIIIVVFGVIGAVLSASITAFGFARINFKGKNLWFALILSTMMIPYTVIMIPQFIMWTKVGAFNTFYPLIIPAFFGHPFNIFLVRQFYAGIPKEYDEAALVDGANYLTIYSKIILPMSKPALTSVGIFTFMSAWNDFMGPLLYLDDYNLKTLSLGLQSFMGQYTNQWNLLMAASVLIVLPMIIVFFFAQKYFIEGANFSGLKG